MTQVRHASLFTIVGEEDGQIFTSAGGRFDTDTYSRFKYGDMEAADRYGQLLAGTILGCEAFETARHAPDEVVITASAYKSLPTAAQAVASSLIKTLNSYGYPVGGGRIHRDTLTEGDYGNMSSDERAYWMSCNGLWINEKEFIARDVIVIDDVSISGAHANSIIAMFATVDIRSLTLVHVLKLDPELAARDPKIEDRMNHTVIKNLRDLGNLIRGRDDYRPNARTVKFVLSQPVPEIENFLSSLGTDVVDQICAGIEADEYDRMRSYMDAAKRVRQFALNRKVLSLPLAV